MKFLKNYIKKAIKEGNQEFIESNLEKTTKLVEEYAKRMEKLLPVGFCVTCKDAITWEKGYSVWMKYIFCSNTCQKHFENSIEAEK